jgi:hypothetical protein
MVRKAILLGSLGQDPELNFIPIKPPVITRSPRHPYQTLSPATIVPKNARDAAFLSKLSCILQLGWKCCGFPLMNSNTVLTFVLLICPTKCQAEWQSVQLLLSIPNL